ncbi:MAG: hypothetical protein ACRD0J_12110 [Acidimicrobiales bacterium]
MITTTTRHLPAWLTPARAAVIVFGVVAVATGAPWALVLVAAAVVVMAWRGRRRRTLRVAYVDAHAFGPDDPERDDIAGRATKADMAQWKKEARAHEALWRAEHGACSTRYSGLRLGLGAGLGFEVIRHPLRTLAATPILLLVALLVVAAVMAGAVVGVEVLALPLALGALAATLTWSARRLGQPA